MNTQTQTPVQTIDINAKQWFDRINGNSYFSAEVVTNYGQPNAQTFILPFQYGYGDHYIYAGLQKLNELGLIGATNTATLRDSGVIVRNYIQKNCKKRELI